MGRFGDSHWGDMTMGLWHKGTMEQWQNGIMGKRDHEQWDHGKMDGATNGNTTIGQ